MSIKDLHKEKEALRKEVARKIAEGQSFDEHFKENSAFSEEDIKHSKMIMVVDGEEIVIYPDCADEEDGK